MFFQKIKKYIFDYFVIPIIIFCSFYFLMKYYNDGLIINLVDHIFPFDFSNQFQKLFFLRNDNTYLGFNQGLSILNQLFYVGFFALLQSIFGFDYSSINNLEFIIAFFCSTYFSYLLLIKLFPHENKIYKFLILIISTYLITNTLSISLLGVGISQQILGFSGIPLMCLGIVYFDKKKILGYVLLIIGSLIISNFNLPYAIISFITVILFLIYYHWGKDKLVIMNLIIKLLFVYLITNLYWIIPFLTSTLSNDFVKLKTFIESSSNITDVMYLTAARYKLEYIFAGLVDFKNIIISNADTSYIFQFFAQTKIIISLYVTFGLTIIFYISKNNNKKSYIILIYILLGLFLSKGINEPLGYIYEYLVKSNMFFKMFRDSFKRYIIVVFFLMLAASDTLHYYYNKNKKIICFIIITPFLIFLYPWLSGNFNKLTGYKVPDYYYQNYDNYFINNNNRSLLLRSKISPTSYSFDNVSPKISSNIKKFLSPYPIVDLFSNGGGNSLNIIEKIFSKLNYNDTDISILYNYGINYIINQKDIIRSKDTNYSNNKFTKKSIGNLNIYKLKDNFYRPLLSSDNSINFTKVNPTKYIINIFGLKGKDGLKFLFTYSSQRNLYANTNFTGCVVSKVNDLHIQTGSYITGIQYIVNSGETFYSISKKIGLKSDYLYDLNQLETAKVDIGQILLISPEKYPQLVKTNYTTTECKTKASFFEGEELSYLWQKPLWNETHNMIYDYANGWNISFDGITGQNLLAQGLKEGWITQNSDGSYNLSLVLFFRPQSWFYLGLGISGATFLALMLGLVIISFRKKKIDKMIKFN